MNYCEFFKNKISFYLKTELETYFKEKVEKKENYTMSLYIDQAIKKLYIIYIFSYVL